MRIGLCETCAWVRPIENDRGSVFYLCGRAKEEPQYTKYPRLPVLRCNGYEVKGIASLPLKSSVAPGHE